MAEPELHLETNLIWQNSEEWFGGWSGAQASPDGKTLTVISDKGRILRAALLRENNRLTGVSVLSSAPLLAPNGSPLIGKHTDAEGLAIGANGRAYISFEHDHRLMEVDPATGQTFARQNPPDGLELQLNSGFEALAITPDGTLYTLPERSGGKHIPFPLYALKNGKWRVAAHIPRRGPFLPVGADFDTKNRLWLLERAVSPLGFRSRIRRFDLRAPNLDETTLITSTPARFDNLEALTVWQDPSGQTRALAISDDNFFAIQRTQIVEFLLTE